MTSYAEPAAVFEEHDGSVVIDPALMEIDRPYPFRFDGGWYIAVKRRGGDIDTYTVSDGTKLGRWLRQFRLRGLVA